mmetsp:Transcript_8975/g.12351  ORF Transcript_8975/g.12351 Transcript_8975/m.12351 type:complete len:139 (+) Transcript_8975:46-462(+)
MNILQKTQLITKLSKVFIQQRQYSLLRRPVTQNQAIKQRGGGHGHDSHGKSSHDSHGHGDHGHGHGHEHEPHGPVDLSSKLTYEGATLYLPAKPVRIAAEVFGAVTWFWVIHRFRMDGATLFGFEPKSWTNWDGDNHH